MNKLYTLCVMVILTACGGVTPPVWDGNWENYDDDGDVILSMLIVDFAGESKNVFIKEDGDRIDSCNFVKYEDAQTNKVEINCNMFGVIPLEIKEDNMTMLLQGEQMDFKWVGDQNKTEK